MVLSPKHSADPTSHICGRIWPEDHESGIPWLHCPTQSSEQGGIETHLTDEETEAQPSLRPCSWYEVSHSGWHTQGFTATSLWVKLDPEGLGLGQLATGRIPYSRWNSEPHFYFPISLHGPAPSRPHPVSLLCALRRPHGQ